MKRLLMFCIRTVCGLLLAGSLAVLPAKAQLTVVKDNIACAYGVKNTQGQWVIPAVWMHLEKTYNGNFICANGNGRGILSPEGKILVPCSYTNISPMNTGHYIIEQNQKKGILSPGGTVLFAPEYETITRSGITRFLLYRRDNGVYFTTCIDTGGHIRIPETRGYISSFREPEDEDDTIGLIGSYPNGTRGVQGEAGLIDATGKLLLPRIYDAVEWCQQDIAVLKNGKLGKMTAERRWIFEPQYRVEPPQPNNYGNPVSCISGEHLWMISENRKFGLMKGNGTVVQAPAFDHIIRIMQHVETSKAAYTFGSNGKTGLLAQDGSITVPAIYDTLQVAAWIKPGNTDPAKKIYYLFKQNGRCGLMKDDGRIIINAGYDFYHRTGYQQDGIYLLTKDLQAWAIDLSADSVMPQPTQLVYHTDSVYVFRSHGRMLPLLSSKQQPTKLVGAAPGHQQAADNAFLYQLQLPNRNLIFTAAGKRWGQNNIQFIDQHTGNYALVHCENGRQGLVNFQTGRMLIDTVYQAINKQYAHNNIIWAQVNPLTDAKNGHRWMMLDTNGNRKNNVFFDAIVHTGGGDTVVTRSGPWAGLMDENYQWIIPPQYQWIHRLAADAFVVFTRGGRFGILNSRNQWLADSAYAEIMPVYGSFQSDWTRYPELKKEHPKWWLLRNGNRRLLQNSNGFKLLSLTPADDAAKEMDRLLNNFALKGRENGEYDAFRLNTTVAQDSLLATAPYRTRLAETTRVFYEANRPCAFTYASYEFNSLRRQYCSAGNDHWAYTLRTAGRLFYTLETTHNWSTRDRLGQPGSAGEILYHSYYWRNGQLTQVKLADIFGSGTLLQTLLVKAIRARDDLNLDCSTPEKMVANIGDRFTLSAKGITLYYTPNIVVELLIPVAELQQHPESRWLTGFLK